MKMKKSVLILSLALAVMFGMMAGAKASDVVESITATLDASIKVVYNGETQEMKDANGNTVYPISYEGTTYLPVRAISNLLGLEVNWDGPTRTVWLGEGFVPTPADVPTSDPAPASTGSTVERTPENNYGFDVQPGFHVEPLKNGKYALVNDETGFSVVLVGDDSLQANGYVAGTGQIGSDAPSLPEGHSWAN